MKDDWVPVEDIYSQVVEYVYGLKIADLIKRALVVPWTGSKDDFSF